MFIVEVISVANHSVFDTEDKEGYMDVYEAADKWNMTPCEVSALCYAKLVRGAEHSKIDGRWMMPEDAPYPYNTVDDQRYAIDFPRRRYYP